MAEQRQSGTVKFFNAERRYGFIRCADLPEDVFVHESDIVSAGIASIEQGDTVEFELQQHGVRPDKRRRAIGLKLLHQQCRAIPVGDAPKPRVEPPNVYGSVKAYDAERGSGYIKRDHDDSKPDIFFSIRNFDPARVSVEVGEHVKCELAADGGKARSVSVIE